MCLHVGWYQAYYVERKALDTRHMYARAHVSVPCTMPLVIQVFTYEYHNVHGVQTFTLCCCCLQLQLLLLLQLATYSCCSSWGCCTMQAGSRVRGKYPKTSGYLRPFGSLLLVCGVVNFMVRHAPQFPNFEVVGSNISQAQKPNAR